MDKKRLKELLEEYTKGTGLFPEAMMAQILTESGHLKSGLTVNANNFSGQKIFGNLSGKTEGVDYVVMDTEEDFKTKKEVDDYIAKNKKKGYKTKDLVKHSDGTYTITLEQPFKKFNTPEEGIKAHIDFLQKNPRYTKGGVFAADSPEEQIQLIKDAGYATDQSYVDTLTKVLNDTVRVEFPEYATSSPRTKSERTGIVDDDIKDPLESRELAQKFEASKTAKKKFTKDEAADIKKRLRSLSLDFANDLEERYGTFNMFEDQDDDDNRQEFTNLIAKEFDLENVDLSNLEELGRARATIQLIETTLDDRDWVEEVGGSGFFDSLFEDMAKDWWTTDYRMHKELGIPRMSDVPDVIRKEVEADSNLDQFEEIDWRLWDESRRELNPAMYFAGPFALGAGLSHLLGITDPKALQDYDFTGGSFDFLNITGEGGDVNQKWKSFIEKFPEAQKQYLEAKDLVGGNLTVQQYLDKISAEDKKQQEYIDKIKKEGVTDQDRADALQRHEDRVSKFMDEYNAKNQLEQDEKDKLTAEQQKEALRNKRMRNAEKVLSGLKAAAGVLSLSKALKDPEIDVPELSPLLVEAVEKQRQMSKSGLTAQEKSAAMQGLNNAYAGAMKNVLRASGGQRGMYLAGQGVVDANRIAGLNQLAAQDAALHRQNIQQYNQLASSAGQMQLNRDMTAEQMKQAAIAQNNKTLTGIGSNLISDALSDVSWYMNPNRDLIEKAKRGSLESMLGEGQDLTWDPSKADWNVSLKNIDTNKLTQEEKDLLAKIKKTQNF